MTKYAEILAQIPDHLRQYVVDQDYSRYTPVDQATWRFILRQLKSFLTQNAHECYVEGLEKTGISTESIPRIEVMCEKLQQFGWTAVPVSGFIPPAAFMEMQSLGLLPIASDMRSIDHILYTPAPDIVHEAAGHAPILVDNEFAQYLKDYAQVAKKAIISSEDLAQYEAIRDLSDIKENPNSSPAEIAAAETRLQKINASISHVSEAALLGRMNWWTAEYGLIGDLKQPKIFGAGLLSSVGEARGCLKETVKKIPLSIDCIKSSYDITEQQPHLFVATSFSDLSRVLKELEAQLSYKRGGVHGLETAKKAATVNTVQINSGLQISGQVSEFITNSQNEVIYYKMSGPCQLSENGTQLPGHGKDFHAHGFSSPLGRLTGVDKCLSDMSQNELQKMGLSVQQTVTLFFESGVSVHGTITSFTHSQMQKLMVISFENCTVKNGLQLLFDPSWGTFDMAVGSSITSVFGGPADRKAYGTVTDFVKKVIPRKHFTEAEVLKHALYQRLRDMREGRIPISEAFMGTVYNSIRDNFPEEWLAFLEVHELSLKNKNLAPFEALSREQLKAIAQNHPDKATYITLGLELAGSPS